MKWIGSVIEAAWCRYAGHMPSTDYSLDPATLYCTVRCRNCGIFLSNVPLEHMIDMGVIDAKTDR